MTAAPVSCGKIPRCCSVSLPNRSNRKVVGHTSWGCTGSSLLQQVAAAVAAVAVAAAVTHLSKPDSSCCCFVTASLHRCR